MSILSPGAFRLLLAVVVVVNHFIPISLGSTAVYIFFMLSGFWIHSLWGRTYSRAMSPYALFMVSRLWRLLPVFYVVFALLLVARFLVGRDPLLPENSGLHFYASHLVLLGYSQLDQYKLLAPAWSLDAELQFYILAPLTIAILNGRGGKVAKAVLGSLAIAGFCRAFLGSDPTEGWVTNYLVYFAIGMCASKFGWSPSHKLASRSAQIGIALIVLAVAIPATRSIFIAGANPGPLFPYNVPISMLLALGFAPYAMCTVRQPSSAFDRHAGNLSYVLYLVHWVGVYVLLSFYPLPLMSKLLALAATLGCVFVLSLAVYWLIDRPSERLRHRYVRSRSEQRTEELSLNTTVAKKVACADIR